LDPHAGFAGVIAFGQQVIQERLSARHGNGQITRRFQSDTSAAGGAIRVETDFYIDVPRLTLSSANNERLQIALRGWGFLTVTLAGQMPERRRVRFETTAFAAPLLTPAGRGVDLGLDPDRITLDPSAPALVTIGGGAFSPAVASIVDGDAFRAQFAQEVIDALAKQQPTRIDLSFVGDLARARGRSFVARALDGVLLIGVNVESDDVTVTGDPALLSDVRNGHDIAYWINPAAARAAFSRIGRSVEATGATVDVGPIFALHEGSMHVFLIASNTQGQATIEFDLAPRFGRFLPGERIVEETFVETTPGRTLDVLWFESSNVRVDVIQAGWVAFLQGFLGVFTLGVFAGGIQAIVDAYRSGIEHRTAQPQGDTPLGQRFTLRGTSEPVFRGRLEVYEIHEAGVFAGLSIRSEVFARSIVITSPTTADELARGPLTYRIALPFGLTLRLDRQLRIRWTVRRLDTGEIVDQSDAASLEGESDLVALGLFDRASVPELEVACRIYRTLGPDVVEELYQATRRVRVVDPLDRRHPFVRWRHETRVPNVRVNPDGTRDVFESMRVERFSHIHRTDLPGRCRFASEASGQIEYLDDLPFPRAQIVERRKGLCDYCFFGGPTKNDPLI